MATSSAYKYIVVDNQELCYMDYKVTHLYYSSQEEAEKVWNGQEHLFRVLGPFRKSRQTGWLARLLTRHERGQPGERHDHV